MFSKTADGKDRPVLRSAAWRISLWATLAFALGTMLVFTMLHRFVANDIQRRSDAWLTGEVGTLSDVAERTPKDRLYGRVVGEVAELASREVPNKLHAGSSENDSVFFLQAGAEGPLRLWVGAGDGAANLEAIRSTGAVSDAAYDVRVRGFRIPFRVASVPMKDGSSVYLGLSERDELRVLRTMRARFFVLWLSIVLLGFAIVFYATSRMLGHVREITEAASRIGRNDLSSRVPSNHGRDEAGHLASTLNHMLDRIESTVHQLHTMTDSLAHDLRSPLTAIRGKLEIALSGEVRPEQGEPIVSAIDELDRLTEFLNTSLDVAEARVDALRLTRTRVDLDGLMRSMIDLYEPCLTEKNIRIELLSTGRMAVFADAALVHRLVANLLDNELKHLAGVCTVSVTLREEVGGVVLILEDDGPGFAPELMQGVFKQRVKGKASKGHGLGLAFVEAVVRAHGGSVAATNRAEGGARLTLYWPAHGAGEHAGGYAGMSARA